MSKPSVPQSPSKAERERDALGDSHPEWSGPDKPPGAGCGFIPFLIMVVMAALMALAAYAFFF